MLRQKNKSIIISYLALRRFIGIQGMALPFVCILGGVLFSSLPVQTSISSYYHTNMRDFFVGLLMGMSFFLFTYKGYELIDTIIMIITGIAGFGIAIFPCLDGGDPAVPVGIFQLSAGTSSTVHFSCAISFFVLLAITSLFLFTMSNKERELWTDNKKKRNIVYRTCGIIILAAIVAQGIIFLTVPEEIIAQYKIILILETVMLEAFGISWLVKGRTLFRDRVPGV